MPSHPSGSVSHTDYQPEPSGSTSNAEYQDIWKCGDPLNHPLSENHADHWSNLLEPLVETDKEQCKAWKEEIENLLLFAGLFSAVVTAFVIVSFQAFRPSPNQVNIALLAQIATTLNNLQRGTLADGQPIPVLDFNLVTSPSSQISRVNVLWFVSLVLSLTAALGGIVGLQWLREYQRSTPRATSQEKFAYFNLRRDGLEEWYVPHIFSSLPVLLLLALVLFLIGLADFLLVNAPLQVSAPIIAVMQLPIIFIILTTIFPSFEWILPPTIFVKIRGIPAQCPYKSPQSFLLRRFLSPIISLPVFYIARLLTPRDKFQDTIIILWKSLLSTFPRDPHRRWSDMIALYYREICHEELYIKKKKAQLHNLTSRFRDPFIKPPERRTYVPALYDLIGGLKNADRTGGRDLLVQAACYQCVQNLVTLSNQKVFNCDEEGHRYIQSMLQKDWPHCEPHFSLEFFITRTSSVRPEACRDNDLAALEDETRISALRTFNWDVSARSLHGHELHIRLMHYYLDNMGLKITLNKGTRDRLLHFWRNSSPVINKPDISKQYTCLLRLLFTRSAVFTPDNDVTEPLSFLPHPHLAQFVETACRNQTETDISTTIELIKVQTGKCSSLEFNPPDQYLLLVLMTTYIRTVAAGPSHISAKLNGVEYREMHTQFGKLVVQRIASEGHLLRESALGGELTDGYLHFVSPNRERRPITPTTINSNSSIDPSAMQSTTSTVPPTMQSHGPPPMSPTTTQSNQNPPADAHVTQSPTIPRALNGNVPSRRTRTNNRPNNSKGTTLQAIPLAAAPSSSLEEDFPGERIPPSPLDRRQIWYATSQAARDVAVLGTIQDV